MPRLLSLITLLILSACAQPESNHVAHYLSDADLQIETEDQQRELARGLRDMLTLTPEQLELQRYADYRLMPNQWSAPDLLNRYLVPSRPNASLGSSDDFYREITTPAAQAALRDRLEQLERSPAASR